MGGNSISWQHYYLFGLWFDDNFIVNLLTESIFIGSSQSWTILCGSWFGGSYVVNLLTESIFIGSSQSWTILCGSWFGDIYIVNF
jgi:hypothetical protein